MNVVKNKTFKWLKKALKNDSFSDVLNLASTKISPQTFESFEAWVTQRHKSVQTGSDAQPTCRGGLKYAALPKWSNGDL